MIGSREIVLGRIRAALADARVPPVVPRAYREHGSRGGEDVVALFVERVEETGATVVRSDDAGRAVGAVLRDQGAARVVAAPDLPAEARPGGVEVVEDEGLTPAELDGIDGAVTTCATACAETGTIAFDGGDGQGRRAITLVPDLHVCVVRAVQIVETVPSSSLGWPRPPETAGPSSWSPARPRRPTSSSSVSRASTARGASSSCWWTDRVCVRRPSCRLNWQHGQAMRQ